MENKTLKDYNKIIYSNNDFRNISDKNINLYGINQSTYKLIDFSSATANHPSEYSYKKVLSFFYKNKLKFKDPDFFIKIQKKIKKEISSNFNNIPKKIYLCPSGTDAEYLSLLGKEKKILNIVFGINEIGSSIRQTASGKIFSKKAPHGNFKKTNLKLDILKKKYIKNIFLPISENNLFTKEKERNSYKLEQIVGNNIKSYDKIIIHLVYSSKSQKIYPNIKTIQKINRKYKQVKIVVDACQFRCENKTIIKFLTEGYDVIITGSKFYSGPPFCSAYLTNQEIAKLDSKDINKIFNDYELVLKPKVSYGLSFRWFFALNEMALFNKIPTRDKLKIMLKLIKIINRCIRSNEYLEIKKIFKQFKNNGDFIEDYQSIFLIFLKNNDKYLTLKSAREIYGEIKKRTNFMPLVSQPMDIYSYKYKTNIANVRASISASHIISIYYKKYCYKKFNSELLKVLNFINERVSHY
jgi:hypothetical protein